MNWWKTKKFTRPSYKILIICGKILILLRRKSNFMSHARQPDSNLLITIQTSKENVETQLTISGFSQDSTCYNEDLQAMSINKVLKCFWGFLFIVFSLCFLKELECWETKFRNWLNAYNPLRMWCTPVAVW